MKVLITSNAVLSEVAGLCLGILLLSLLVGCGGTDADPTGTPVVAASPTTVVQETPSPKPPPATVDPSASPGPVATPVAAFTMQSYPLPTGSRPHDVVPALDGGGWYTVQISGEIGWLDPDTGSTRHTPLGTARDPTA